MKNFFKNGFNHNANALPFNKHTGSNNFSKLIVEFGFWVIVNMLFFICYVQKYWQFMKILLLTLLINKCSWGTGYFITVFYNCSFIFFFFDNQSKKSKT